MLAPEEILESYRERSTKLKARGSQHKELQDLTMQELILLKQSLHPTGRKETKELTRRIIEYICEKGICTTESICADLNCTDKPVLQRLRKMKMYALVRRESNKYYLATSRLLELQEKYLDKVCD